MSENGRRSSDHPPADLTGRLATILPGDAVSFRDEGERTARTVFICNETIADRTTEWRWIFLDDGSLLEVAPKGCFRYSRHQVLEQGSAPYEELVAQDGALVRFERRVRRGTWQRRPVRVTLDGRAYRVAYTGTASGRRFGGEPELGPWRSFRTDPSQNVYFGLLDPADRSSVVLGLWTAGVCLSFGAPLAPDEISDVRHRMDQGAG